MTWRYVTAPTVLPIHLTDAKLHLRVDASGDDNLIRTILSAATEQVQQWTGWQLVDATLAASMDNLVGRIELRPAPLLQIDSVTYVDTAGSTQTVSTDLYDAQTTCDPGAAIEEYGDSWPTVRGHTDDVTITYRSGLLAPVTIDATANTFTNTTRTLADSDVVRFINSGGSLPTGISADTDYYVRDYAAGTFAVAATDGGAAIDITAAATPGQTFVATRPVDRRLTAAILMLAADMYEHREACLEVKLTDNCTLTRLLWGCRL